MPPCMPVLKVTCHTYWDITSLGHLNFEVFQSNDFENHMQKSTQFISSFMQE